MNAVGYGSSSFYSFCRRTSLHEDMGKWEDLAILIGVGLKACS